MFKNGYGDDVDFALMLVDGLKIESTKVVAREVLEDLFEQGIMGGLPIDSALLNAFKGKYADNEATLEAIY